MFCRRRYGIQQFNSPADQPSASTASSGTAADRMKDDGWARENELQGELGAFLPGGKSTARPTTKRKRQMRSCLSHQATHRCLALSPVGQFLRHHFSLPSDWLIRRGSPELESDVYFLARDTTDRGFSTDVHFLAPFSSLTTDL